MAENPNQPREYDAVLGGQNLAPADGLVLGGVEGVKRRLSSGVEEQRIAALSEALKYGEAGLDLVIGALQDESGQVGGAVYRILRERVEPRVKQALRKCNPWQFESLIESRLHNNCHSDLVPCVAISPDGQTLVSGSDDNTIKLWNLHNGKLNRTLHGDSGLVNCVAISPDGKTIVSGSTEEIVVWGVR